MKIRHFLPMAALALPLLASARPAAPGLQTLVNADGTSVEAYVYGNENFSWVVSADGKTLLEYEAGKWNPVVREGHVLSADEDNIELLRFENDALTQLPETTSKRRMANLDSSGRSEYPCQGEVHALVVLVEYADTKFSVPNPQQAFYKMCNEEGYSAYNGKGSARDYYIASSNGKFRPIFDVVGPVTVSNTSEYYTGANATVTGAGKTAYLGYAWKEALEKLDPEVDFSKYDYDNDGVIDNIFFFYAGFGQADSGIKTTIWPHQGDFQNYCYDFTLGLAPMKLDGKSFRTYACSNELQGGALPAGESHPYLDGIGAFVHEFGHVLGLPDTYDIEYGNTQTPGYWDVMCNGTYNDSSTRPPLMNAYQQWVCKWLEYDDILPSDSGHFEVPSLSKASVDGVSPKAYRLRINRPASTTTFYPEYYVVETRTFDGWDSALPGEGMIIWHVDYKKSNWVGNTVNYAGISRLCPVLNSYGSTVWPGSDSDPDKQDTYIYSGSSVTLPINTYGLTYSPVITSIAFDKEGKTASFDFNTITQLSTTTLLHNPEIVSTASREFRLSWDAVEEATNYYLTVERMQGNRWYTVDGYNNKPVGNVTEVVVRNVSPSAWNQTMRAFVVPGNEIPGQRASNTVTFVPANSSVGEIELSGVVRGDYGRIEAPAGARVYNTSGVETGSENLPAGMYIVVVEGKSVKVVVK